MKIGNKSPQDASLLEIIKQNKSQKAESKVEVAQDPPEESLTVAKPKPLGLDVKELTNSLVEEMRSERRDRIEALKQQIKEGAYQVGNRDIAQKIMEAVSEEKFIYESQS